MFFLINKNTKVTKEEKSILEDWCDGGLTDDMKCEETFIKINDKLRNNREFLLGVIKNRGYCWLLSEYKDKYNDDDEVVFEAVSQNGYCLEYATERLKANKKIAKKAIESQPGCMYQISDILKDNKSFIKNIIKTKPALLYYASDKLKNDKEVILECSKKDKSSLMYASQEFQELLKDQDKDGCISILQALIDKEKLNKSICNTKNNQRKLKI